MSTNKYSKTFFVKLSYADNELVRKYSLNDGDIINCTVLGLFDSLMMLVEDIHADYEFELFGTEQYWTTGLYLPENLVLDYGIEKGQNLDIKLCQGTRKKGSDHGETFSIYGKTLVNAKDILRFPEYETKSIQTDSNTQKQEDEILFFPPNVMEKLPREVSKTVTGIQLNYEHNYPRFCCWGMRTAIIDAIRIRFKKANAENELYDSNRTPYKLSKWIDLAKQKGFISQNQAKSLKTEVKVFGDTASHDYMGDLHINEIPPIFKQMRLALSRMYYQK